MQFKTPSFLLALALLATSAQAAPQPRYRITPITAPPGTYIVANALNNWGEVVGSWAGDDIGQHGFYWRNGQFVDLNDLVHPDASYVEAVGINNRAQIIGHYAGPTIEGFRSFVLRHGQSNDVAGPTGATEVFATQITDLGVIRGNAYDAEGNYSEFLNDDGAVEIFDPSFEPSGINEFRLVSGRLITPDGPRAALWRDGVITPIAPPFSASTAINERGQVIGTINANVAAQAFLWERGQLRPLPKLRADQTYSWASAINNFGRVVGSTVTNELPNTVSVATVWDGSQVFDLNALIHPADPRRGFVTLHDAVAINDLGQVLARGVDSRTGTVDSFLVTPVWP